MTITKVSLINYRNHQKIDVDSDHKFILISGQNGSGKTNLLEAISLLAPGRGLRSAKFDEIIGKMPQPANEWAVCSEVNFENDLNRIATGYSKQAVNAKRIIKINETVLQKQSDVLQYLKIMWLTPQMDGIFLDSPSVRRRLLDRLSYNFYPEHATEVAKYEHYLRSRIKLLTGEKYDDLWMSQLEKSIVDAAVKIAKTRIECVDLLNKYISEIKTAFIKPHLQVKGQVEDMISELDSEHLKEVLKEQFKSNRFRDAKSKRTNFGTHISDLKAVNSEKNIVANLCSTGEQKAMLISMLLAQIKAMNDLFNCSPIVLLDEVFTHLDENRRNQLAIELNELKAQIWITSTEPELAQVFEKLCHINF
jgi:DNA replication and repair protein RecF